MANQLTLVTSQQNPVFKDLVFALEGQGEAVLAHGLKVVRDLLEPSRNRQRPNPLVLKTLLVRSSLDISTAPAVRELLDTRYEKPVTRIQLDDALFDQIDPFGVPDVIAAFERPALATWSIESEAATKEQGLTLLLATQNPANLGACLRSAAAFGVSKVVCLKEAASPFHPRAVRGSMGHAFDLRLARGPSIHELSNHPSVRDSFAALDMGGTSLDLHTWKNTRVLVVGEEGQGIPKDWRGAKLSIPIASSVDSLNAAISCGIALYDFSRKTGIS